MPFKTAWRCSTWAALAIALCGCAGPRASADRGVDRDAVALRHAADGVRAETSFDDGSHAGPAARSDAVPTAAEIFDFHPPGSRAGSWREPFVVSYTEGPLNAYRTRTLAELERLRDHSLDLVPPPPPSSAAR